MANIEKIRDDLYIKKGWDGYRVVYPNQIDLSKPLFYRNPETKRLDNINWKNFVGQWHFWVKGLFILIALYFFVQMYLSDISTCRDFIKDIDKNCRNYISAVDHPQKSPDDPNIPFVFNSPNETKETS